MNLDFTTQGLQILAKDPTLTPKEISQTLSCSKRRAREIVRMFKNGKRANPRQIQKQSDEVNFQASGDSAILESPSSSRVLTLEDLLTKTNIDLRNWEVDKYLVNKWDNYSVDGGFNELYQIKAWLKKKISGFNLQEFIDEIKKDIASYTPHWEEPVKYNDQKNNLVEINIFDLHYGKLCWAGETGENFDRKIAAKRFGTAIQDLIEKATLFGFDRILFPIGNDFYNVDNQDNTTTAGTRQHEDGRWQKTFLEGKQLLIDAIAYLREFAPVDVVLVPGNHDEQRSFYVATTLEAYFNNCNNVTIDIDPKQRKYIQYGKCMIGLSHGSGSDNKIIKPEEYPNIMASEDPKMWAKTKYREMHLGHIHHTKVLKTITTRDYIGITVRYLRSLTGRDAWHTRNGFIGVTQSAEAYIWNKENGLIANLIHNL